ncbi:NAD(P)/FAD-dependent oxidoreductase [Nocardioides limicola]|uniref:NAD(P)/FAD-dependent oxidoreductase n=1 Tax=Nocardioides limicola TaxID=2803368 RepID=UPI00193B11A8|nr:FAD-dependent oxidoreductase [Nocardioides sp. DJM-14]
MTQDQATEQHTGILVVGGGEAGVAVATQLRTLGYAEAVTIVGGEPYAPYQRPPLSKGFLNGTEDEESLELRASEFFEEQRIVVWTGRRVEQLDLGTNCTGGVATLDDGSRVSYDGLALATGASARTLPGIPPGLRGVHTLRGMADAIALRAALDGSAEVVVIGGGFIGLEVAATARSRGARVTVVETMSRLLQRLCAPPLSEHCLKVHRDAGIDVLLDCSVASLRASHGAVTGVELDDGTVLRASLVVVGIGAVPDIELAQAAGLRCQRGVVVDAAGRTGRVDVVAAGDCTVQRHPHRVDALLGIESVHNAVEQGKAAAHVLLGLEPPAPATPWFWSDQGDLKIQMAGISDGYDDHVVRKVDDRLTVLYYRHGNLIAVEVANNPREFMILRRALDKGHHIDRDRAEDVATPLRELVQSP